MILQILRKHTNVLERKKRRKKLQKNKNTKKVILKTKIFSLLAQEESWNKG